MQSELRRAREIYEKDSETIGWHVMQHEKEPSRFCSELRGSSSLAGEGVKEEEADERRVSV